ncbi:YadA-like family protein [Sphingobium phenoxybenzoativorans]|uniref:YadA-like family protein n=1 Tax=Sphingobium phenoxybenzoativorans TaxID=1592790 RepID=A0A975K581_9SPHN|nr:YadA-like family protein [Sphingobium phenoxybenzoativorans]QUT05031.1 YadA-like family protein [Sphingobium phenoxybenzoativorans]
MSINMFRGFGSIRRAVRAALGLAPVVAMAVSTQPVYAAPPANNIVSACSGVSLPRSVVTDIMSPVITGVATPTEASVNSLLGVVDGLILGPLLGVPTLNINATGLLNNAAAGQPITLQAISNSGTVIGPSDPCYSQATGFTLATPAGIAVGGNQITGLGSGTAATSGELNSIAFGNGAITNASALGSIAFGTNAQVGANAVGGLALGRNTQVTAAGSVALGDGSIASRGALTNYSATGLSALQSSAGEVSVGVAGSARQITNVAAGSSATDAVNVAQLQGVAGSVTALDTVAIKYNDGTRATATLGGAGGTTIANLRAGAVSASSMEAVNGSQLFATNSNVTANGTAINTLRNDVSNAAIGALRYANAGTPTTPNGGTPSQDVTLVGGAAGAVKLHNVADGAIAAGSTDAVNGGQIFNLNGQINLLADLGVQYDDSSKAQVTLGGAGAGAPAVTIANVKAGALGSTSTEAVNGSQLFATNSNVTTNANAITNLRNQTLNGAIGTVQFSSSALPTTPNGGVPSQDMTLVGGAAGAVKLHNVANGAVSAGSTDAVNGGQLFAVSGQVDLLSGLAVQYDDGTQTQVTLGSAGTPVRISNVANGALNAGSTEAVNGAQLFATNQTVSSLSVGINNGSVGPVRYSNSGTPTTPNGGTITNDVTMVGAAPGAVRIHNVADGSVAAGSTDGVNGGQLYTLQTSVTALGGLSVQYVDGSKTSIALGNAGTPVSVTNVANGTIGAGSTDAVNGGQLFTTNQNVTNNSAQITNLANNVSNGAVGLLRYSNTGTPTTPNGGTATNDVTIVGGAPGAVRLHNVASGNVAAGSTDAVNGGQLFALQGNISALDGLAVQYDDGTKSRVTLGGVGAPAVTIANVGNGAVNAASSEAINGSQLFATSQTLTTAINAGNAFSLALSNSVSNGGIGPVQYSTALTPTVPNGGIRSQNLTLVGSAAGPVGLHNVANGLICNCSTDAVNGGQLFGVANSVASILGYTYNPVTNSFSGNFTFGSDQYADVQNVFTAIYDQMTAGGSTSNTASKYFHTTSLLADSTASGADSTAIGPNAVASGEAAIATGRDAVAAGDGSVAIGNGATAQNGKAVSIGFANVASGDGAVAIGDPNMATGEGAIAMGKDNTATGDGAVALGNTNSATGDGTASVGYFNIANGLGATAIGDQNQATGDGAFAAGSLNMASGANALAIGTGNMALGDGSMAIGRDVWNSADDTLAIGALAAVTSIDSIAIGNRSTASGESSTAVGNDTLAQGIEASAFGDGARATGTRSTALGSSAIASGEYSMAVGESSSALGFGASSFGLLSQANGYAATALGSGSIADHDGSVALGSAARTTRGGVSGYSAFGLDPAQTSLGEVAIARNLSYLDINTGLMTPTGDRQITGVAAGSGATDAVNVSQLRGVASNIGTAIASSLGGGITYDANTGKLTMPSFVMNGTTYTNVGDALAAISGSGSGGSGGNSPVYDNSAQTSITLNSGGTTIHNVAAGAVNSTSTDAVNGSQLASTNQDVTNLSNQVDNGSVGTVQYSSAAAPSTPNGGTKTNDVTLVGAQQAPVGLHNVAAGRVAAGSTDAVNGDQLAATNDAVSLAQAAASRAVQYDGNDQASVTLGSGDTPVALHNIAPGVSATDAVNVAQLDAGMSGAISQANAYTDARIAALSFDLRKISRDANAGTAGALAVAGLPQTMETGRGMLAMAAGTFQGQHAMAIGFSKASDNGRTVVKAGATYNSRGQVGANVGIGWQL